MDIDPRNGMELLTVDQCWELLGANVVGRLAVAPAGRPDIFPVNYLARSGTLLFKTGEGSKLTSVAVNQSVAFEIDGYDADSNEAWSVVVIGTARLIETDDDSAAMDELPLFPWNTTPKYHYIEVTPTQITGRRFVAEGRR
jgi:nitroimidazol reductase NimA-like FMN-containing flavoprotein (pyridoxamine 5'-phosphate oxidase superfamily)